MSKDSLNEREFELVNIVGAKLAANQRDLSEQMKLSLGQTNMLIRRLVTKGYIRISQLNQRKVQYLLTPKGMAEKMRKSVNYVIKTLNSMELINGRIEKTVMACYNAGERNFIVLGKSDFALMIDLPFKQHSLTDYKIQYVEQLPVGAVEGTIFICKEGVKIDAGYKNKTIDLINELAKDHYLTQIKG
jgi:predicted transcriptional regulator